MLPFLCAETVFFPPGILDLRRGPVLPLSALTGWRMVGWPLDVKVSFECGIRNRVSNTRLVGGELVGVTAASI